MTLPNANKPELIEIASLALFPTAFVLLSLSDPARSTKLNLDTKQIGCSSALEGGRVCFNISVKMAWDLDDVRFISVLPVVLHSVPFLKQLIINIKYFVYPSVILLEKVCGISNLIFGTASQINLS
jgi:hypothetical protein